MIPEVTKIIEDMNKLVERVRAQGDDPIPEEELVKFSSDIAYVVYELRRKYKLISGFYTVGEMLAIKKYDREYDGGGQ